ncbi:exodeoxyribonuclease VII small subunit [Propionibacteriaceae bacterium Y1923]|uniref:exodeoxyribonuclease VII small subunit n=1 Tax=Aestuariimicrobium sp. Y1814 TaxID=3418742 RepID=UPI003C17924F
MTETPQIPYEQARAELAEVVTKLESGRAPLAESMQLWQRGEQLAEICQQWLDGARATVEAARKSVDKSLE